MHHLLEHLDGAACRTDCADDGRHTMSRRRRVDVQLTERFQVGPGERRRQLLDVGTLRDERHPAGPARNLQEHAAAGGGRRAGRMSVTESGRRPAVTTQHLRHCDHEYERRSGDEI